MDLRATALRELSQELCRFDMSFRGKFRCPTCFQDFSTASSGDDITEEHVIPKSVGGKLTTLLCKACNSRFGHQQTRWLSDYIALPDDGLPFHRDGKKQKASATAKGLRVGGTLREASDGVLEFVADRRRSNPTDYDLWHSAPVDEMTISYRLDVFKNEPSLQVGFLTAAYGLWFKNFGYSWAFQTALDDVRRQIQSPDSRIIRWNFLMDAKMTSVSPSLGLGKFHDTIFPVANIYDQIVIFPNASSEHPASASPDEIRIAWLDLGPPIHPRFQHRCVGPAILVCDGQRIVAPDLFPTPTVPAIAIEMARWS